MAKPHVDFSSMSSARREHLVEVFRTLYASARVVVDNPSEYTAPAVATARHDVERYAEKIEALLAAGDVIAASEKIPALERELEVAQRDAAKWRQRAENAEAALARS